MATTKAFELAQLSALTTVDASGNVTTNTSQIANASGDLTLDSVAGDIVLDAHGNQVIFKGSGGQVGFIDLATGRMDIKSSTADQQMRFQGNDAGVPINALVLDMSASGAATFLDQVTIGGNLIHAGNLTIDAGGDITLDADGADIILADGTVPFGRFAQRASDLVVKVETVDKDIIFRGTKSGTPNVSVDALVLDMSNNGRATFNENVVIQGDLTVEGTQVTLNTTALDVEDKNITLNYHASNDTSASAGGAGITIQDAVDASNDASILWDATNDEFDVSHSMKIAGSVGVTNIVTNKVVKFNGTILDDSNITDDGTTITASSDFNTSGQMTFTTNAKAIRMRDSNGLYTRSMILNASDVFYIGPVDAYAGGAILYGASADVTDQQFYTGGTLRHITKSTGDFQWYEDNSGADQVGMHWDYADGRLGIGTTTPTSKLEVFTTDQDFEDGSNAIRITHPAGPLQYDVGGGIVFAQRWYNQSTQDVRTGGIYGFKTIGSGAYGGGLAFYSQPNSAAAMNRSMVINHDSNLGIGTDSPNSKLTVNTATTGDGIELQSSEVSIAKLSRHVVSSTVVASLDGVAGRPIHVGGVVNEDVILANAGGNVGIGTSSPVNRLHVDSSNGASSWTNTLYRGVHISDDIGGRLILEDTGGDTDAKTFVMVSESGEFRIHAASDDGTSFPQSKAFMIKHATGALHGSQVRHNIRPTVSLDFAKSKELDPRISFYRNSIATYYDSKGILRYATHNEPRFDHNPVTGESRGLLIEEDRQGLNTNTITVNGGYWGFSNATATIKQAVAPDGTFSADAIHANTVNDGHGLFKAFVPTASTYYTLTGYYKRGANRYVSQAWYYNEAAGNSNFPTAYYDLDNGTFTHTAGINRGTTMTDVGNGWYRCSLTVLTDSTPSTSYFYATSATASGTGAYVGTGATDTYYWGLQVEIGPNPTSFIPSDTRFTSRSSRGSYHDENGVLRFAGANEPRYGYKYDGRKWVETGLIHEAQAENLLLHSEDLENWSVTRTTLSPNIDDTTAPDGSKNANKLEETAVSGEHAIIQHRAIPSTGLVTLSIYAKAAERSVFGIQMYNGGGTIEGTGSYTSPLSYFDLSTGTVSDANSGINPTITPAGNGWYRITISGICNNAGTTSSCWMYTSNSTSYTSHLGVAGSGVYLWGGQLEMGHASSYIRTVGQTTRSADIVRGVGYTRDTDYAYIDLEKHNFWNDEESTIYAESETYIEDYTLYNHNASIFGFSPNSGRVQVRYDDQSGIQALGYTDISGSFAALFDLSPSTQTFVQNAKVALSMKQDDYDFSVNGSPTVSDSGGLFPSPNRLFFGSYREINSPSNSEQLNGAIRKFSYYDTKLTNAELQALTENN